MKRQDAGGSLELIREFINTRDLELRTDALSSPGAVRSWLADRGLMDHTAQVTEAAWRHTLDVREALRAMAACNSGAALPTGAGQTLDELAEGANVRLRVQADGTQILAPRTGGGPREALGRLMAIVGAAAMTGTWPRLKVCPAADCLYVFYDHSKNRSGVWCQMGECGNRAKARRYRSRHPSAD